MRRQVDRGGASGSRSEQMRNGLLEDDQRSDPHLGLRGDWTNIALLFFLYTLQGIPLGLVASIPLILQNKNISYKDQAVFSFAFWPFSVKLLWAPIVDAVFVSRFGRRKSWLVPTQYLIGIFMIVLSTYINDLLGKNSSETPCVYTLMTIFFMLNFLAATQDIAVDGWALTMLSRRNIGYASTCNSVGQTAGYFIGNVILLALESASFSNSYLRTVPQEHGVISLSGYLFFWGIIFIITTTVVMLVKRERNDNNAGNFSIAGTYKELVKVLCLPSVISVTIFLLTAKIGFAATDAVSPLKLLDSGMKKEHMALMAVPMVPVQIILPVIISRYTAGPRPLDVFLKVYPIRLLFGLCYAGVVYSASLVIKADGTFPAYYYAVIILAYAAHQVTVYSIFVALMAFYAKVSDPLIGGTYMTLLNTLTNLGGNWPNTVALWFTDYLTYKECQGATAPNMPCYTAQEKETCVKQNGSCQTVLDGYYIEIVICLAIGFIWLIANKSKIRRLQSLPPEAWRTRAQQ